MGQAVPSTASAHQAQPMAMFGSLYAPYHFLMHGWQQCGAKGQGRYVQPYLAGETTCLAKWGGACASVGGSQLPYVEVSVLTRTLLLRTKFGRVNMLFSSPCC